MMWTYSLKVSALDRSSECTSREFTEELNVAANAVVKMADAKWSLEQLRMHIEAKKEPADHKAK